MKKLLQVFALILVLLLVLFFAYYSPTYVYRVFVWQDADYDDYTRFKSVPIRRGDRTFEFTKGTIGQQMALKADFEKHGLVADLDSLLKEQMTYAFLVIRNDTLLYEKYFEGNTRESLQTSFSTAKSFLSILVGMAIAYEKIISVEEPITKYLPELAERDQRFHEIRIEDLLRMRSGIQYDREVKFPFVNSDDPLTYSHPNLRKVALTKIRIETGPDEKFLYNNYNALLIGLILERALGRPVSQFMESKLWKRIGMAYNASWSMDENNFEKMESGINARAIDFAKVGRLILNRGEWEGEQIIDSGWLERSTAPSDTLIFRSGQKWGYGFMWWSVIEDNSINDIFACGALGQFLYISPEANTIIVRHANQRGGLDDDDWTDIFTSYTNNLATKQANMDIGL